MYQTKGVILRRYDIREVDRGYVIYTREYGKKQLLTKGIRKIKSKLAGHLAEFAEVNLNFVKGRIQDRITGVSIEKNYNFLKSDLMKIAIGNFILDVVDNLIKLEHPDKDIYDLLLNIMEIIDKGKDIKKCYFSANIFIWKLLILLGYRPELSKCAICGSSISSSDAYFDGTKGGFICAICASGRENLVKVNRNSIEYLMGKKKTAENGEEKEIIRIVGKFLHLHLEKVLKSEVWVNILFNKIIKQ